MRGREREREFYNRGSVFGLREKTVLFHPLSSSPLFLLPPFPALPSLFLRENQYYPSIASEKVRHTYTDRPYSRYYYSLGGGGKGEREISIRVGGNWYKREVRKVYIYIYL